jgi:hypothetical protein
MTDVSIYSRPVGGNPRVSRTKLFFRVIGVCFFSVLSLAMAFYAFIDLPQVQDLLFDAHPGLPQEILYWAGFYAIGVFVWVLPLVFTARLLLLQNFDAIGIDTEGRFKFYVFWMPSFFVVLAFTAVLLGVINASANLPTPDTYAGNQDEVAIRAFLETHLNVLFFATLVVLAMVLVRSLFLSGYGKWIEHIEKVNPHKFKRTLLRIDRLTRNDATRILESDLHLSNLKPNFLSNETWVEAQRVKVFMWRYMSALTILLLVVVAIHYILYSGLFNLLPLPAQFDLGPLQTSFDFLTHTLSLKRATLLFVIFGAWLPFVTILALLSNRFQFPVITTVIAVAVGLTLFIGDGHDVRIETLTSSQQSRLRPIAFADAVKAWKDASGWTEKHCEGLDDKAQAAKGCPRPIIVSGEGGGSRAAFLLASVLGILEDESLKQAESDRSARPFDKQLFAISTVSGSSVGAAFFVGALKARPGLQTDILKKALIRQRLWFRNVARADDPVQRMNFVTDFVGYKDALQAALSNDFLSPNLAAYLTRDLLIVSRLPRVMDRAGVLETSWESAFDDVFGSPGQPPFLTEPLQTVAPSPAGWTPLLFMNATSIETGRRVLLTPVKLSAPVHGNDPLLIDAYDMHELLCSPYPDPFTGLLPELSTLDEIAHVLPSFFSPVVNAKCADRKPTSIDVRLSTAASVSSRSPFVSPHAVVRDTRGQVTDSVVDGGFFDNSGAVTALEIANGLKAVDRNLRPFIVEVSSEPDWFKETKKCGAQGSFAGKPRIPDEPDFRPIGAVTDLLTVDATRISRGYETILELPDETAQLNGGARSVAQFYICPQLKDSYFSYLRDKYLSAAPQTTKGKLLMRVEKKTQEQATQRFKSVSLSWWLSPPLQAFLDGQIYADHNIQERSCVLSLLRDPKPGEPAGCPPVPQ